MARLAQVQVDLVSGIETPLLVGRERREQRRRSRLSWPFDPRQYSGCTASSISTRRSQRTEGRGFAIESECLCAAAATAAAECSAGATAASALAGIWRATARVRSTIAAEC